MSINFTSAFHNMVKDRKKQEKELTAEQLLNALNTARAENDSAEVTRLSAEIRNAIDRGEANWTAYIDGAIRKITNKHPNLTAFYLNEVRNYADNYRATCHGYPNAARLEYFADQMDTTTA